MVKVSLAKQIFWGITIDGNKRYSQIVGEPFHVSMAALDCREKGQGDADGYVSVMLEHRDSEFLLCTLQRGRVFQQKLDLEFARGESLTLYLVGKGTVHLTGYVLADIEEDLEEDVDQDLTSDDSEDEADSDEVSLDEPRKSDTKKPSKKSGLKAVGYGQDSDEDNDASVEDKGDEKSDNDEDDDQSDDDDNEGEDEEDDSEEESDEDESDDDATPSAKRFKPSGETSNIKSGVTKAAKPELQRKQLTTGQTANQKSGNVQRQVESKDTKAAAATGNTDKKKKKKGKNDKAADVSVNSQASSTASPVTKFPVPTKTPVTPMPTATPTSSGHRKTLAGGVTVEEIRVGNGPEAKPGKTAHVYYVGQLSSGKVFDKKTSEKPFNFRLGKNEVIKGWDVGVSGMKVGGKRRLVIPPHMGYGKEKAGAIPPNSTLTFDVELRAVS